MFDRPLKTASFLVIGVGILLLVLNLLMDGSLNIALPLVFLMLGGVLFILVYAAKPRWAGSSILYIPGSLLLAFGLVFLLNVVTRDWQSWAYAWLLLLAGIGVGLVLAYQHQTWPPLVNLIGWGLAVAGVTFFAVFGAIAGGLFIQVMAPILIVLGGVILRWLHPENILPDHVLKRLGVQARSEAAPLNTPADPTNPTNPENLASLPSPPPLVEPLSGRELEVLRLVDQGLSNQEIAVRLHIAASTVKTHINNIFGKLGVQTRIQALNRARELGLLDG